MSSATSFPKNTLGKLFFVSGLTGGREVFLGRALDEPIQEHLALEGKVLSMTPGGRMLVRPFQTTVNFALHGAGICVQHISNPAAHAEATTVLELAATHVPRCSYPFVCRWVETAVLPHFDETGAETAPRPAGGADPFLGFYESFQSTADAFRKVLFRSRQIENTRELDRVTELEGDLLIEIGKITNQAAVRLNQVLFQERELAAYFEALQAAELPLGNAHQAMSGWPFLFERVHTAKAFARRKGKASLVRDLNGILKDSHFGLNEVIVEHSNSLDTLITETFGQYGIADELELPPAGLEGPQPVVSAGVVHPAGLPRV